MAWFGKKNKGQKTNTGSNTLTAPQAPVKVTRTELDDDFDVLEDYAILFKRLMPVITDQMGVAIVIHDRGHYCDKAYVQLSIDHADLIPDMYKWYLHGVHNWKQNGDRSTSEYQCQSCEYVPVSWCNKLENIISSEVPDATRFSITRTDSMLAASYYPRFNSQG